MLLALLAAVPGRGGARPGVELGPGGGVPVPLGGPDIPGNAGGAPGPLPGVPDLLTGPDGGPMLIFGKLGLEVCPRPGAIGGPPELLGGAGVPPIRGGGGVAVFFAASGLSGFTHLPKSLS